MANRPVPVQDYLSDAMLPVGADTGAHASPEDFGGPQRAAVGAAISGIGDKIMQGGETVNDLRVMRAHIQSQQWTSQQMTTSRNNVDKFMADPKNYSDPNFAENLQKVMDQQRSDALKGAPNPIATRQLNEEFNSYQSDRMESAYKTQTDQMIQRTQTGFLNSFNGLIEGYRTNMTNPNVDANKDMVKQFKDMDNRIQQTFGKIAPGVAHDLRVELTSQTAYGVVDANPDLAQWILNNGAMEGRTRHFIQNEIDRAKDAKTVQGYQQLEDKTKNVLAMADAGKLVDPPPLSFYQKYLPKNEAEAYKAKVDDRFAIAKDVSTFSTKVSGWNINAQEDALNDLHDKIGVNPDTAAHDSEVYDRAAKVVGENERMMRQDPTAYLIQNNPTLKSIANDIRTSGVQSQGKFNNFVNLLMKYQGAKPADATDDKNLYLNLPASEQHILSKEQATDLVKKISGATPRDAANMLNSTLKQYAPEHQGIVFNDLVKHGLSGDMWVAQSHVNAPWMSDFIGAVQNSKDIRKDMAAKTADFTKSLDSNGSWLQFSKVTAADSFQREGLVDDVHSSILTYAMAMSQKGMPVPQAVDLAAKRIIDDNHKTVEVNGAPVYINEDSVKNTTDMGRRLRMLLSTVDPRSVGETNRDGQPIFPFTAMAGTEMGKDQAIRDTITQMGEFRMNPDGQSVSLYLNGGELLNKSGKPFSMRLDDVPMFHHSVWAPAQRSVQGHAVDFPDEPQKTYKIPVIPNYVGRHVASWSTNWPSWTGGAGNSIVSMAGGEEPDGPRQTDDENDAEIKRLDAIAAQEAAGIDDKGNIKDKKQFLKIKDNDGGYSGGTAGIL